MRRNALIALVLITVALLVGWVYYRAPRQPSPTSASRSLEPLVWGGPKNISMLPIIAQQRGFFSDVGLTVRPNYVQTGKIAMDAVVSRDLDIGVIVEVNIGFVKFQEGADIVVVAGVMDKYDDAIVARRDQGIQKPSDIEGKSLAILPGTTSHRFADLFIDFYKLDRKRITIVNLTPPAIQASLISGQIPAGSVWQPFRYNVQQEIKDKAVQLTDRNIYRSRCLLAVRSEFARDHADEIKLFLKALITAEQYVRENRSEAIDAIAKELDIAPLVLSAFWDEYDLKVDLDTSLTRTFADTGAWVVRSQKGFEGRPVPSYDGVIAPAFLRDVAANRIVSSSR